MAKLVVVTKRRKVGGDSGYMVCNVCHGTGRQKIPNRRVKYGTGKGGKAKR